MNKSKIAISLNRKILEKLDQLVRRRLFSSRSQAIEEAVAEKLTRIEKDRLARECAKLDPMFERAMAEEGLGEDVSEWPEY
jgi:metal-responsive CopG/Arc/MetJ family transcriptional regulator